MNPFHFLPKAGKTISIPGGWMRCVRWEVSESRDGHFSGTVTFEFESIESPNAEVRSLPIGQTEKIALIDEA